MRQAPTAHAGGHAMMLVGATILQIIPSLDTGGAERATVDIAVALAAAGNRALVMSSGGPMAEVLRQAGAEHIERDVASKNPLTMWKNRVMLRDFIRREKVDLVHVRSRAPAWSAYLATRATGTPLVATFHDAYRGKTALKKFYNGVMARGDRVIAISRFVEDHIVAEYPAARNRVVRIPRGIDLSVFDPASISAERREAFRAANGVSPDVPLIVMPARLTHTKGHALALRALARLGNRPWQFLIIGPTQGRDNYRARLVALTGELRLQNKVQFIERADLPAAYAAAGLVLSPSQKAEGFGRVPVEAQAMGVPVIATALGATSETVLDGKTGWLVPVGDEAALAAAIVQGLSLPHDQRRAMAEAGAAHVRAHFDAKRMCAATLDLYAGVLRGASGQRQRS